MLALLAALAQPAAAEVVGIDIRIRDDAGTHERVIGRVRFAIDPDAQVNTASVIKVALMLEAMYQVKEGRVSIDDVLPLRKEDQVSGSGVLLLFRTPAAINWLRIRVARCSPSVAFDAASPVVSVWPMTETILNSFENS